MTFTSLPNVLLFIYIVVARHEVICETLDFIDDQIGDEYHEKSKYLSENNVNYDHNWDHYYGSIQRARRDFSDNELQSNNSCGQYLQFLAQDMSHLEATGITKSAVEEAIRGKRGIHYQIINHSLYRDNDCLFPSRCEGIEHFIKQVIHWLPDMDLVINVRDYPQVHHKWHDLPVLSFSKEVTQYRDVLYPAWTFWSGGPAIDRYPTGIGRWDLMRQRIVKNGVDWHNKSSVAFFRGSRTSDERDPLIRLSRALPQLIDAQYTANQAWRSVADTLGEQPAPTVTFEDHCVYKYLVNMRGVAASFRYKHLFLCKSVVLNADSDWIEFFYSQLKPWIHFVPIANNMNDLVSKIEFLKANDEIGRNIAEKGFDFIWNHLTNDSVQCYWKELLDRYSKLLKYKPKLDPNLIKIFE